MKTTLSSVIGAKGVPLVYVIRENDTPRENANYTWDQKYELSVELNGPEYNIDKRTVHQIILRNFGEDSDAYTYLNPRIDQEYGREDIKALFNR